MGESYVQESDNQIAFDITGYKNVRDLVIMVPASYNKMLLVLWLQQTLKMLYNYGQTSQVTAQHMCRFAAENRLMINSLQKGLWHNFHTTVVCGGIHVSFLNNVSECARKTECMYEVY